MPQELSSFPFSPFFLVAYSSLPAIYSLQRSHSAIMLSLLIIFPPCWVIYIVLTIPLITRARFFRIVAPRAMIFLFYPISTTAWVIWIVTVIFMQNPSSIIPIWLIRYSNTHQYDTAAYTAKPGLSYVCC